MLQQFWRQCETSLLRPNAQHPNLGSHVLMLYKNLPLLFLVAYQGCSTTRQNMRPNKLRRVQRDYSPGAPQLALRRITSVRSGRKLQGGIKTRRTAPVLLLQRSPEGAALSEQVASAISFPEKSPPPPTPRKRLDPGFAAEKARPSNPSGAAFPKALPYLASVVPGQLVFREEPHRSLRGWGLEAELLLAWRLPRAREGQR